MILPYNLGSRPQKSPKIVQKRIAKSWFAQILHKNGIYCHTYSESSCPDGKGGKRVSEAELQDLYFERAKKHLRWCLPKLFGHTFDLRAKSFWEDFLNIYIKKSSQEDFALRSKLWPNNSVIHRPNFAGNLPSTGISQLRAGKTRSKRPRSHWLSTVHFLPYMWASFYP